MNLSDHCTVLIQAGGRGTRLQPYTYAMPKPMLPVDGIPVLQRLLNELVAVSVLECHISIGYLGEFIRAYFGDEYRGCRLVYLKEERPLGTVGAARSVRLKHGPLLVVNGDLLLECDLRGLVDRHLRSAADITVGVQTHSVCVPYGVVKRNSLGALLQVDEKPAFDFEICCGLNVLSRDTIGLIPEQGPYDMPCLIGIALAAGLNVQTHTLGGECIEVGNVDVYHQLLRDCRVGNSQMWLERERIITSRH